MGHVIFYMHQTNGLCAGVCAGMCACDCTHQMEKTVQQFFLNSFASSSVNAEKKFWGLPHLLHMCVIFTFPISSFL